MPSTSGEIAIADLLDRALHKGLVIWGEATLSIAGIDLVYVGVKLILASTDTMQRMRDHANAPPPERGIKAE
ncbi:gas vesicle protein [Segnochrobactrum spirostomi]|uniref:Gas vesicle protein n=1 Tax=Segnochrobactrum spirostomi TaxID=2608987 RepID=A0A6A7Y658_9HYPH|nr:gas vesicle protein [Segnochrobactrum spirostomi]MQT14763.1 gas vesicle protein [Segnochrobactrum spirostomi]